jgi:hypothetical protein
MSHDIGAFQYTINQQRNSSGTPPHLIWRLATERSPTSRPDMLLLTQNDHDGSGLGIIVGHLIKALCPGK